MSGHLRAVLMAKRRPDGTDARQMDREERFADSAPLPSQYFDRLGIRGMDDVRGETRLWLKVAEDAVDAYQRGEETFDYFLARPAFEAICDMVGLDVAAARRALVRAKGVRAA